MIPWLKLYTEARNDAKLRSLTDAQHRTWFRLLCYAAEQPERGIINDIDKRLVAIEAAEGDLDQLIESVTALESLQVVTWSYRDENKVRISFRNFTKRNTHSMPSEQPERVRERVAKLRAKRGSVKPKKDVTSVTGSVTGSNDSVTGLYDIDIEEEEERIHIHTAGDARPIPLPEPKHRSPADLAEVNAAVSLLAGHLDTEPVALEIGRQHTTPGMAAIPGWKWVRAAERLLDPARQPSQRRSFAYFGKILAGITDAEREIAPRPEPPKRETTTERKRREWKESVVRAKAKDQARAEAEAAKSKESTHGS